MNGIAVIARRGTKWTGKATGKLTIRYINRMDGTTEAEKKKQPNDRKEEAETVKREKEMGKKTMIQQKKPCAKGSESEYKETKDLKKSRREKRKVEERGDKRKGEKNKRRRGENEMEYEKEKDI